MCREELLIEFTIQPCLCSVNLCVKDPGPYGISVACVPEVWLTCEGMVGIAFKDLRESAHPRSIPHYTVMDFCL